MGDPLVSLPSTDEDPLSIAASGNLFSAMRPVTGSHWSEAESLKDVVAGFSIVKPVI